MTDAKITGPISVTKLPVGTSAGTIASGDHNHKYGKVAVVAKSGGDYTDPVDAMNQVDQWCGTPSALNPCLLKVMPGIYDLGSGTLSMQAHIDIEGAGENSTLITSATSTGIPSGGTVCGANNSEIRLLTIASTGLAGTGITNNGTSPKLTNITVTVTGVGSQGVRGIWNGAGSSPDIDNVTVNVSGATATVVTGIFNAGGPMVMNNVAVTLSGNLGEEYGIDNSSASSILMNNVTVTISVNLYGVAVRNSASSVVIRNSAFIAMGGVNATGIYNQSASSLILENTTVAARGASNYNFSMYAYSTSSEAPDFLVDRSTFEGILVNLTTGSSRLRIGSSKLDGVENPEGVNAP